MQVIGKLEDLINSQRGVLIDKQTSFGGDVYADTLRRRNAIIAELKARHENMTKTAAPSRSSAPLLHPSIAYKCSQRLSCISGKVVIPPPLVQSAHSFKHGSSSWQQRRQHCRWTYCDNRR